MASAPTPGGFLARFVTWTDRLNTRLGVAVSWLTLAMVAVGAYNAVVRYLGRFTGWNLSSNAYLELQWYMFSLVFLLGAAYALLTGAHVRVDVIFSRLPERWRRRIDFWGSLLFLIPFAVFGLVMSWPAVRNSWAVLEVSSDPGGLPRYPIKSVLLVAFTLLALQGLAEAARNWLRLRALKAGAEEEELQQEGLL
ncbi:MAG: TRAP transporter small permease subunit [Acidobacteria bacterium]|nr:TRAP transporter small permease subunit [Acidobacteriota bacterium]MXZ38651.1 TRAP transporter small permease subunit [Holophagales bacterium]MYF05525.1 TRAP transporter small permease subunit [Holophagales bacterium]MYJ24851.1 TRAP transporter small permease subunit [Holophagales bacterium]